MNRSQPRPLVAGNWKMNGLSGSLEELRAVCAAPAGEAELVICPPFTLISRCAALTQGTSLGIGGQDCHFAASGAHTGDVSADMLKDAGASYVIVGHSERRADWNETSALVRKKAEAALRAGLCAIVCVGETHAERENGKTLDVVGSQLADSLPAGAESCNLIVAYEPVWAIGTGLTPTPDDVGQVHAFIRSRLVSALGSDGDRVRILYGGSVKPGNARELMAVKHVNGALVGGASLKAADFLAIAAAYSTEK